MVLAPPSRKDTETYRWVCEAEIAEAPEWLLRRVRGATDASCDVPEWIDS
jgi:hypothetical protein